jgi:phosphoribosyl 1,2-cyclic phosphodiesterase
MELKVLGSNSSGNCYILDNGREALAIEAGVSFAKVKKAVDFDISRIEGCLISHEHGDHAKYFKEFTDRRIPIFTSAGTARSLGGGDILPSVYICDAGMTIPTMNFEIIPFDVLHDASQPFGFLIWHEEAGTTLFATDTRYLPCTFRGLNNIIIECNYRRDILDENTRDGRIPQAQRNRVLQSHKSYDTCLKTLLANDLSAVNNIVLIHLSDDNSDEHYFVSEIQKLTGKPVYAACSGLNVDM